MSGFSRTGAAPAGILSGVLVARFFVVRGRVQNVGYRFFVQDAASREGLTGWVRNRPDGAVEVQAEGDRESVDRFEHQVRTGPPAARIDAVQVHEDVPTTRMDGFRVRT
jgi:acylphosphatase